MSLILAVMILITVMQSIEVINENQRGVILRLGRFDRVVAPGIHVLTPYIERLAKLYLNMQIPGWQELNKDTPRSSVSPVVRLLLFQSTSYTCKALCQTASVMDAVAETERS